jgi:threonine/homoserine/homoserine lactone efflux protein
MRAEAQHPVMTMHELLPPTPLLTAFLAASLVLALTPGPGVLFIVARSLGQGRRAGLASVAGVALGNLGNASAAALGLAVLFAASSLAFTVVKYAGAAYLVYLGLKALLAPAAGMAAPGAPPSSGARLFRDGLIVALLNPKTTLFFAAFLPQFMHPAGEPMLQAIALGALFVALAAVTDSLYALAAGTVAPLLARRAGAALVGRRLSGLTFIGLGLFAALGGSRGARPAG